TDGVGCSSTDSVFVVGVPVPDLTLADFSSCEGRIEPLDGRPDNVTNLDAYNPDWQWKRNNALLTSTNDTLFINTSGTYSVRLTIGQCSAFDTSHVVFNVNPAAVLPYKIKFCKESDNYTLLDAGAGTGYTYLWTTPSGGLDSINTRRTG